MNISRIPTISGYPHAYIVVPPSRIGQVEAWEAATGCANAVGPLEFQWLCDGLAMHQTVLVMLCSSQTIVSILRWPVRVSQVI